MKSLKETVIKYLAHNPDWHNKGFLTDTLKWSYLEKGTNKTYLAESVGRKLRIAEEESRIAVKQDPNSNSVLYRFLPVEKRSSYIPWSMRDNDKKDILFKS
jgi:hypothetical protein